MNLTDNETLKFLKGSPVFIEDICAVFPATLGQIVDEGYDQFQQYLGALTASKPTTKLDNDKELRELMEKLTKRPIFNEKFQIRYTTCIR